MQKLAIFGGTFNPVHWGHLLMAETALSQIDLDRILWTPSYNPPYKSTIQVVSFHHRLEMVQRAIRTNPYFVLSAVEQNHTGPSYAINTWLDSQSAYPDSKWYWITGLDTFESLPHWYRRRDLAAHCDWLVAPRFVEASDPAWSTEICDRCKQVAQAMAAESIEVRWHLLSMPRLEISSSLVRQYCRDRRSIRYLVPEAVREYILEQGLYQR